MVKQENQSGNVLGTKETTQLARMGLPILSGYHR
jgi:hypothetical protein